MSGQHCENCDVKWEIVHCYPRNIDPCCTWLEVAWCCCWNLTAFFKICFYFVLLYNKWLNDWSFGEQTILFPSTSSRETLRFSANKIHCSPPDQSLRAAPRKYQLDLEIAKKSNFAKLAQNEALRALVTKNIVLSSLNQKLVFFTIFFFSMHQISQSRSKMSGVFRGSETEK